MEIKHMTKLTKPGKLRAFFTLEIPNKLIIRDCKLIQNDDGSFFVGTPSRTYEKDGEKKWVSIVEILDADLKAKIGEMALNVYQGISSEPEDDKPF